MNFGLAVVIAAGCAKPGVGLVMVLGAGGALSFVLGDTGQCGPTLECSGTKSVVGGLRSGEYVTTCIESTVQKGELKYPTDIIIP